MLAKVKIALGASILIVVSSCNVSKPQADKSFIKSGQVAIIELIESHDGEALKGRAPEGRRIDGPTYRFDKETKKLEINRKENFAIDTVKALFGYVRILKGAAGSGLSMRLNAFGKFPYTTNNLIIKEVNSEGVKITYDKKELFLKAGEIWETQSSTIDTLKMETPAIIKYTTTYSIQYHGLIDKQGITQ